MRFMAVLRKAAFAVKAAVALYKNANADHSAAMKRPKGPRQRVIRL